MLQTLRVSEALSSFFLATGEASLSFLLPNLFFILQYEVD